MAELQPQHEASVNDARGMTPGALPPRVVVRETSPQHFADGIWRQGASGCQASRPAIEWPYKNRYNNHLGPVAAEARAAMLRIWSSSEPFHEEHASDSDCTHWKPAGVIDHWNSLLYAMLAHEPSLLRPFGERRRSIGSRWQALKKAFVELEGCVWEVAGQQQCCDRTSCRLPQFLPVQPPAPFAFDALSLPHNTQ